VRLRARLWTHSMDHPWPEAARSITNLGNTRNVVSPGVGRCFDGRAWRRQSTTLCPPRNVIKRYCDGLACGAGLLMNRAECVRCGG